VNRSFYGNLHNQGHNIIGSCTDPFQIHAGIPGVMSDVLAAVRDPVFWMWHKHIDEFGYRWEQIQTVNDISKDVENVQLEKVSVKTEDINDSNILHTYMKKEVISVSQSNVGWVQVNPDLGRGEIVSRVEIERLHYKHFQYTFEVQNDNEHEIEITFRVFLVPGEYFNDRRKYIEMDKFQEVLKSKGQNVIRRKSIESSVLMRVLTEDFPTGWENVEENASSDYSYCRCGLPRNLLLPRGTRQGKKFKLVVVLTKDEFLSSMGKCCQYSTYCGSRAERYPDPKPMGYPFDRKFKDTPDKYLQTVKHVKIVDVIIQWTEPPTDTAEPRIQESTEKVSGSLVQGLSLE